MDASRAGLWLRTSAAVIGTCVLLLLPASVVLAQVTRTTTVTLPKGGTRTITFEGAAEADVAQAQTVLEQLFRTARMKDLVEKVGRNFTVKVVRDSADVKLGEEDQANFRVLIDLGDIERAKQKLVFPRGLSEENQNDIRRAVDESLLPLILAHEVAGLAQPGHEHKGSPQAIIPAVNAVLNSLRERQRIKLAQSGDCFSVRGVTRMDFTVSGLEKAPGQRIPGVTVSISGDVNEAPGPFSGPCSLVERIFVVDSVVDQDDFLPGDGECADRDGNCTLRAALTEADQTAGLDAIHFDIPGEEVPTIRIDADTSFNRGSLGALRPVLIDGTTQLAGVVEIDGSSASPEDAAGRRIVGLDLVGEGIMVRGLVINRFPSHGILIRPTGAPSGGSNFIEGNVIGADPAGMDALGNAGDGLRIENMPNNVIGFNLISGNGGHGISIATPIAVPEPFQATGNKVLGNLIGTDLAGVAPLGNTDAGVAIRDEDSGRNEIAVNGIAFNGGSGIDLGGEVAAPVAPGLNSAFVFDTTLRVEGSLGNSLPSATFVIEFFDNAACDSSGLGEGQTFIGSEAVATDAAGNADFLAMLQIALPAGRSVTATATDPEGNTSAFSPCVRVSAAGPGPLIDALISQIGGLPGLNRGQKNSLIAKLEAARRSLLRASPNAALGQLNAFINEVLALVRSGRLNVATADVLLAQARTLLNGV